jgi:alpha-beta hydrolase superfamily lysophospholipase
MLIVIVCTVVIVIAALAGMIAFGAGAPPAPLASIGAAFEKADFSTLPPAGILPARNGAIAFRVWPASPKVLQREIAVIAIHGSSATSHSLHPLARELSAEGMTVYAPDIRGHGGTGRRGDIDDAGQLDGDLAELAAAVRALHVAGSPAGQTFARTVLLAPMLGPRAPTARRGRSPWVTPYVPRIIAILLLNKLGIHAFDHLPALAFGIPPARADLLTGTYSFRLMRAFGTLDYAADLKNAASPLAIVAGEEDELFFSDKFEPAVKAIRADVPVTVIPGLNHIDIIADPRAAPAIAAAVRGARAPAAIDSL